MQGAVSKCKTRCPNARPRYPNATAGVQMQEALPFGYRHTTERSFTNRDRIIVGIQMERSRKRLQIQGFCQKVTTLISYRNQRCGMERNGYCALVNKTWTQGATKRTGRLKNLHTTTFFTILLGGKVIEGIGRALLIEEDHIYSAPKASPSRGFSRTGL